MKSEPELIVEGVYRWTIDTVNLAIESSNDGLKQPILGTGRAPLLAPSEAEKRIEALLEERDRLIRNEIETLLEQLDELEEPEEVSGMVAIRELTRIKGQLLERGHVGYWNYHCVTCGLWLVDLPEQEGYCQCE